MRRHIDAVEIKEPPIREFEKKNSCLKRTCIIGCGGIVFFIVVIILLVKFAASPRIKELHEAPGHFPNSVPIYDAKGVDRITISSGKDRWQILERVALLPKLLVAPILVPLEKDEDRAASGWERFIALMRRPVTDQRDVVDIEWTDLSAQPKFIQNFYQTELAKNAFTIMIASETDAVRQFTFEKDEVSGLLFIRDDAAQDGTDYARLTIRIPQP